MSADPSASAPYEPVAWTAAGGGGVRLLDQTLLPAEERYIDLHSVEAVAEAISTMRVRGAPAIGITAAYGLALAARLTPDLDAVRAAAATLGATRPTAVNLRWALDRVLRRLAAVQGGPGALGDAALDEARDIHEQQRAADAAMARHGAALVAPGATALTHCNTGPLATGGGGTALGVLIEAHRAGTLAGVLVDETRPRLQGMRLTSWELGRHGVPYEVIADGAAASLMAAGEVQAAFTGADRIAANGDTANKLGTFPLAIAARHHEIPFYVVAPLSTIDPATPDGASIPIEERSADEVLLIGGSRLAPRGAEARNPAFDVTPAELITAIVTERGVLRPPFADVIIEALREPATP